ncbi:MAG: sugar phosphate isomerase/epimerase [Candidatus Hydrogenedentes bacterium]|nr:sugar phosphate isomerase/epimerase [Candidatus Hydrogenedentota bacterium]
MKLSMMTYSLARNNAITDPKEMLELTVELGMDGIDFVTLYGHDAKDLRALCDDHGVPVVAHTFFSPDLVADDPATQKKGLDTCKRGIEAAHILGAPVVMIPTPGSDSLERGALRERWITGLERLAPVATQAGIALTVENFPGARSPFVTAADFEEAKARIPSLKLTYDNGNAAGGEDPVDSLRRTFDDIVHIHFKDWYIRPDAADGYRPMLDGRYFKPALIGEGDIDTAACWNALDRLGYQGHINLEYEGDEYGPREAMRKAVDYLRAL